MDELDRNIHHVMSTRCDQVDLVTEGGITVTAAVPSGASTGVHEAPPRCGYG